MSVAVKLLNYKRRIPKMQRQDSSPKKFNATEVNGDNLLQVRIKLHEVFNSYQGEAPFIGLKFTFIRFARCNLNCPWCDTMYTPYKIAESEFTIEQILEYIEATHRITFTGGEPSLFLHDILLIWKAIVQQMIYIDAITFETNGVELPRLIEFVQTELTPVAEFTNITWSPKFYEEKLFVKNMQHVYNRHLESFDNITIKIVADYKDAKVWQRINRFLQAIKDLYGYLTLRKIYIMPLTEVNKTTQTTDKRLDKSTTYIPKEAWQKAIELAEKYDVNLSPRLHIEAGLA